MHSTHSPLNLRSANALDVQALLVLDKYTGEESDHVGTVKKDIRFLERHALVESSGQMINPNSILPAHMLLFTIFFLLATKQQALWGQG